METNVNPSNLNNTNNANFPFQPPNFSGFPTPFFPGKQGTVTTPQPSTQTSQPLMQPPLKNSNPTNSSLPQSNCQFQQQAQFLVNSRTKFQNQQQIPLAFPGNQIQQSTNINNITSNNGNVITSSSQGQMNYPSKLQGHSKSSKAATSFQSQQQLSFQPPQHNSQPFNHSSFQQYKDQSLSIAQDPRYANKVYNPSLPQNHSLPQSTNQLPVNLMNNPMNPMGPAFDNYTPEFRKFKPPTRSLTQNQWVQSRKSIPQQSALQSTLVVENGKKSAGQIPQKMNYLDPLNSENSETTNIDIIPIQSKSSKKRPLKSVEDEVDSIDQPTLWYTETDDMTSTLANDTMDHLDKMNLKTHESKEM